MLDVENPVFQERLDKLVVLNNRLVDIGNSDASDAVKNLQRIPAISGMVAELLALYFMKPVDSGSMDFADFEPNVVY